MDIEARIKGTRFGHIVEEFFTNSAHFPIVTVFLELLLDGPHEYFGKPDFYAIVSAVLIQSFFAGTWRFNGSPRPLTGNLISPAIYTAVEAGIEGIEYFNNNPVHWAFWSFSTAIGVIQFLRLRTSGKTESLLLMTESVVRTAIPLAGYRIFEGMTEEKYAAFSGFISDKSHIFVALVMLLTGLIVGAANVTAKSYMNMLRETAARLRTYSEWLLGRELLNRAVKDSDALSLQRRERTVFFMDIRGFTGWSETQPPEKVVRMLNGYFETAEEVWKKSGAIKVKLTADEIMLVFPETLQALSAAFELRKKIGEFLIQFDLAAGIGIHSGPLTEGLVGSSEVKGYDVIGDTVNTAKRLCDSASAGEILVSEHVHESAGKPGPSEMRSLSVKGKKEPLTVFSILPS